MNAANPLVIRQLGLLDYEPVWQHMQAFTNQRDENTADEFWLLQHPPIFTLGQAGKAEHLLAPADIPVIKVDRGGQVTYHGPGQLVIYLLVNIKRHKVGVREFVSIIENSIVNLLARYGITAQPRADAPGVYVNDEKIAALGLRVRKGCTFHGLSLNVDMDMEPFLRINPCGYQGMKVTQMADQLDRLRFPGLTTPQVGNDLIEELKAQLGYNQSTELSQLPRLNQT